MPQRGTVLVSIIFLSAVFLGFAKAQSPTEAFCLRPPAQERQVPGVPAADPAVITQVNELARESEERRWQPGYDDWCREQGLYSLHGQLMVDAQGNGIFIFGLSGSGKSRLCVEALEAIPEMRFISNDRVIAYFRDGVMYAGPAFMGENPLSDTITYRGQDERDFNSVYHVRPEQIHRSFVAVRAIVYVAADVSREVPEFHLVETTPGYISEMILEIQREDTLGLPASYPIRDDTVAFYDLTLPQESPRKFEGVGRFFESMFSDLAAPRAAHDTAGANALRPPAHTASPIDSFCAMSPGVRAELDTVSRTRWAGNPAETLREVRIDDIGRLEDLNDPSIRAYIFSTDRGKFLVFYEHDSWNIAAIAAEMMGDENKDFFIDLSGEPYFETLKAQFARVDMETKFINGNVGGKIYAPLVRSPRDADALRHMTEQSIFLRHLVEDERVASFGASGAGVYHFWRTRRKHQGLMTVAGMPQVFTAVSLYSMGSPPLIAHEMVHMIFSFALMQSHAQRTILWNYLHQHHHDFMQHVIGDYYLRELTGMGAQGRTAEAARLLASETLSVMFDSFVAPRFDEGRQTLLRREGYVLRARDVNLLIALGLIPKICSPGRFGYEGERAIDLEYYKALSVHLVANGEEAQAAEFVETAHSIGPGTNALKMELRLAIESARAASRTQVDSGNGADHSALRPPAQERQEHGVPAADHAVIAWLNERAEERARQVAPSGAERRANWDDLGFDSVHGQLMADPQGNGIFIMGASGSGKSRLCIELLEAMPQMRIVADDRVVVYFKDGIMYAGPPHIQGGMYSDRIDYRPQGEHFIIRGVVAERVPNEIYYVRPEQICRSFVAVRAIVDLTTGLADSAPDFHLVETTPGYVSRMIREIQLDITTHVPASYPVRDDTVIFYHLMLPQESPLKFEGVAGFFESIFSDLAAPRVADDTVHTDALRPASLGDDDEWAAIDIGNGHTIRVNNAGEGITKKNYYIELFARNLPMILDAVRANGNRLTRVCELCAGRGILAVALAIYLPDAEIIAVETQPEAAARIRENARANGVGDRVTVVQEDMFSYMERAGAFDLIVADPPFIPRDMSRFSDEQLRSQRGSRTQLVAIFSGNSPDGRYFIDRLIAEVASRNLRSRGALLFTQGDFTNVAMTNALMSAQGLEPLIGAGEGYTVVSEERPLAEARLINSLRDYIESLRPNTQGVLPYQFATNTDGESMYDVLVMGGYRAVGNDDSAAPFGDPAVIAWLNHFIDERKHVATGGSIEPLRQDPNTQLLHGELLVDPQGNGILIVGQSGAGKSRLCVEVLETMPQARFISDDAVLCYFKDGVVYGGPFLFALQDPRGVSFSDTITYRPMGAPGEDSYHDEDGGQTEFYRVRQEQIYETFVPIRAVVYVDVDLIGRPVFTSSSASEGIITKIMQKAKVTGHEAMGIMGLTTFAGIGNVDEEAITLYRLRLPYDGRRKFEGVGGFFTRIFSDLATGHAVAPVDITPRDAEASS